MFKFALDSFDFLFSTSNVASRWVLPEGDRAEGVHTVNGIAMSSTPSPGATDQGMSQVASVPDVQLVAFERVSTRTTVMANSVLPLVEETNRAIPRRRASPGEEILSSISSFIKTESLADQIKLKADILALFEKDASRVSGLPSAKNLSRLTF